MSLLKPDGLLFDKDGTLLDYKATFGDANIAVANLLAGHDSHLAQQLLDIGGHDFDTGQPRSGSLLAAANLDEITEAWLPLTRVTYTWPKTTRPEAHLDHLFQARIRPTPIGDLAGLFDTFLRSGLALGIATADSEAGMRRSLDSLDILGKCAFAAGYDSGHGRKPDPDMLLAFAKKIGAESARVWMIGDNAHDIDMALKAKAVPIGVLSGTSTREALVRAGAQAVIPSVHDLPSLIVQADA